MAGSTSVGVGSLRGPYRSGSRCSVHWVRLPDDPGAPRASSFSLGAQLRANLPNDGVMAPIAASGADLRDGRVLSLAQVVPALRATSNDGKSPDRDQSPPDQKKHLTTVGIWGDPLVSQMVWAGPGARAGVPPVDWHPERDVSWFPLIAFSPTKRLAAGECALSASRETVLGWRGDVMRIRELGLSDRAADVLWRCRSRSSAEEGTVQNMPVVFPIACFGHALYLIPPLLFDQCVSA